MEGPNKDDRSLENLCVTHQRLEQRIDAQIQRMDEILWILNRMNLNNMVIPVEPVTLRAPRVQDARRLPAKQFNYGPRHKLVDDNFNYEDEGAIQVAPIQRRHNTNDSFQMKMDLPSFDVHFELENDTYLTIIVPGGEGIPLSEEVQDIEEAEKGEIIVEFSTNHDKLEQDIELYARRHFLFPPLNIEEYNDRVMGLVCSEAQDAMLQKLLNESCLSEEERDVLRWGKNIASAKTRTKKRVGVAVYNRASSLETLVGYLYLTNVKRLEEIMQKLGFLCGASPS